MTERQSQPTIHPRVYGNLQPWTSSSCRRSAVLGDHADSEVDSSVGEWMGSLCGSDSSCPSSPTSICLLELRAQWPTSPSDAASTGGVADVSTPASGPASRMPNTAAVAAAALTAAAAAAAAASSPAKASGGGSGAATTGGGAGFVASVAASGGGVRKLHSMQWSYSGEEEGDAAATYSTSTMSSNSSTGSSSLAGMPFVEHSEPVGLLYQQQQS